MPSKGTVWLAAMYEPAPGDTFRPLRSHYAARALLARGYSVVQWCAGYSHRTRNVVATGWEERELAPGWTVRFVPNPAYDKNVGVRRLASEATFARNFHERARREPPPVCIVAAEPPRAVGDAALKLGRHFGVPVVSDVIDLWPEFFHRLVPRRARGVAPAVFRSLYARRRRLWEGVDGLLAVSHAYVGHALEKAPALKSVPTACVYSSIEVDFVRSRLGNPSERVDRALPEKRPGETWVGYAGALGLSYEMPVFLRAAAMLRERGTPVRFIVAGSGPFAAQMEAAARIEGSNLTFLGILPPDDLYPMLGRCDVGLLSYAADTTVAIPDKFYDYAAAGLPMVNSLQGEAKDLIERWEMGVSYVPGDAEAMVAAITGLATDPASRARLAEGSLAGARSWDAPKEFERFADLLEETMRRRSVF